MSDIPRSERSESPLRAQHMVYNIRKRITAELMATFGYSEKHFEKHLKAVTAYAADDEREELAGRIREQEEGFNLWFIEHERSRVMTFCQDISVHMRAANTIWPEYWPEYEERRLSGIKRWRIATCSRMSCNTSQKSFRRIRISTRASCWRSSICSTR